MKKYLTFLVLGIILSLQLTFARVATPTSSYRHKAVVKLHKASTSSPATTTTSTSTIQTYRACVGKEVSALTKQMQNKKKDALKEFKVAYRNATSTSAKMEIRKTYNQKIKEINRWFNQEVRKIKEKCRNLLVPTTITSTPSESSATTSQE